ncbi:ATP-binding protein [Glaciecola siphonariae]|uniref:histidine kinase n=1 Tax=Glaciecola siphonariae TaxID=521012 RepID=A0ABV9LX77_9ALTE
MRLKSSLIIALMASTLIPLMIAFYFLTSFVSKQHTTQVQKGLEAITKIAQNRILSSVDKIEDNTALVASRTQLRTSLHAHQLAPSDKHLRLIDKIISDAAASISNIQEISVFDMQGAAVASTLDTLPANIMTNAQAFPYITLRRDGSTTLLVGYDELMLDGSAIGIIKLSVQPNFIREIVNEVSGLGRTGEWVLAIKNNDADALFVSSTRYDNEGEFNRIVAKDTANSPAIEALYGDSTFMWDALDYAGNPVVAATGRIDGYDWGIVAKIHTEEVFEQIDDIEFFFAMVLLSVMLVSLVIGISLSYLITRPLESLATQATLIKDNTSERLKVSSKWTEVRLLTERFNDMLQVIKGLNDDLNEKVKERTRELAQANQKLSHEKHRAEEASRAKSLFLANMSHELRTPLNSIHGSLQLLSRQSLNEKANKLISTASYSMKSLLGIISDILDFSKIEAQAVVLEKTYFNFEELVTQVVNEMDVMASKKGIFLSYEICANYHEGWLGDALRIKQVLVNLVSNAIKFTEKGSVVIKIGTNEGIDDDALIFSVIDSGHGMTPEYIEKLFDRFSQADASTTRKFGGTGLGMPISLGLINLMEGQIKVDSEVNKGSNIRVIIPLQHIAETTQDYPKLSDVEAPDLNGKTILLAEDNEINQVIFCSMLEETKATVLIASNGLEALSSYKEERPDIIFLDIHMPIMDGIEACKAIRAESSSVPLVSITANISSEDIEMYSQLGFDYHVGKPVDLVSLYKILRAIAQ